jgi:hypothetical protein
MFTCRPLLPSFLSLSLAILLLSAMAMVFGSCTKIVDVELPSSEPLMVVEGTIRNGEPPLVILSKSQGYFDPVGDVSEGFYLGGAEVTVSANGVPYILDEICTQDLSPDILEMLGGTLGIDPLFLAENPLCAYTSFDEPALIGAPGVTYDLHVLYDTLELTSSSKIENLVPIDSTAFVIPLTAPSDSMGFISTSYTDPDTLGNCYRWASRRVGVDPSFIYPIGSAWDDSFANGIPFSVTVFRYSEDFSEEPEGETGFWKTGDTVLVRFESIDRAAFSAVSTFEAAASAQGNPFAPPTNVITNIEGGLGWWIAYSTSVDTVFCN